MHTINATYKGLALLLRLNWDLMLYVGMIALVLIGSAYTASAILFPY